MKRCPRCNAEYFDNMLEFCLDDGMRLTNASASPTAGSGPSTLAEKIPHAAPIASMASEETVVIPASDKTRPHSERPSRASNTSAVYLDYFPLVVALLHNWWQWVYLEKTYVYSITDYILSANFLMWLLLFAVGVAGGIYSFKKSTNKTTALISLITLAINLILFLVPRR